MAAFAIGASIAAAILFAASTWLCLRARAERRRRAEDRARIVELEATLTRYTRIDEILTEARQGTQPRRARGHLRLLGAISALLAAKHVAARSAVAAGAAAATLTAGTWTLDEGHVPTHPTPPAEATPGSVGEGAGTGRNAPSDKAAPPVEVVPTADEASPDPTTTTTVPPTATTTTAPPSTTTSTRGSTLEALDGDGCALDLELAGVALDVGRCA